MTNWIVADWHLGEDRFELMGRPFTTQEEMIVTLRDNHNALVKPEDHVHVVGDVCYQKTPQFLSRVAEFNGKKTLYRGNHDRVFTDAELAPYFETIVSEGDGVEVDIEGIQCYITHYPSQGKERCFNLVGHIHAAWKYQLNSVNIGVDVHHFRPVPLSRIPFFHKAITEFYDADVWVGYNKINASWYNLRGKKNTYLHP